MSIGAHLRAKARASALIVVTATMVVGGLFLAPSALGTTAASARSAGCRAAWGSSPEAAGLGTERSIVGVRSGRHACFDRIVIDLGPGESTAGYDVRYVNTVRQDGSGAVVPLRGGARLQITVLAPAYDTDGRPTYSPRRRSELVDLTGYRTLRQAAWAGSFEGRTTIGLGVRARLPMRVIVLDGPGGGQRVVVDVAHTW